VTVVVVEGEQFTAPAPAASEHSTRGVASIAIAVLAALLVAAAGLYFTRDLWRPKPVVIRPRILTVGNGAPFATIAAAMAEARSGDTVDALAGEYHEPIQLKSGVTLESQVPREAVLRLSTVTAPAIVAQSVKDARLSGFRIAADPQSPLATGILAVDSNIKLDQLEIEGATVGIEARGSSRISLVGSAIHDCLGEGVLLSGPVEAWIAHNSFQRNKAGLVARDGAKPALVGNVFEKNPIVLPPEIAMDTVREHNFILDAGRPAAHGKKKP
jgi:hypothetical protein